ncbi:hypothetical protein CVS28_12605 [Arthrobacter glacialis]|nr:hypothetical protein CVS28_12605 [Arthrobacter glacialis]
MVDSPTGLGDRGLSIWDALKSEDVSRNALALEAARTADRLDELDNIIQGKGVLNLMQFRLHMEGSEDGEYNVEVKFQHVLTEARQQQTTFATLLEKIDKLSLTARVPKGGVQGPLPAGVTALDKIRARVKQETG